MSLKKLRSREVFDNVPCYGFFPFSFHFVFHFLKRIAPCEMSSSFDWCKDECTECLENIQDIDLEMARRDREKLEEAIKGQGVLQSIEEIAGELYSAVYQKTINQEMQELMTRWKVETLFNSDHKEETHCVTT